MLLNINNQIIVANSHGENLAQNEPGAVQKVQGYEKPFLEPQKYIKVALKLMRKYFDEIQEH